MSDFLALVKTNELALAESDQQRIMKLFADRSVTYLTPEREMGPFLLYSVGDDLNTVATKTNLPKDVILATAIQYRWPEKIKFLQKDSLNAVYLQKELANTLLVATYKAMIDDLGQVIAGKKDAKTVGLIPKNMTALQNLMDMVTKLNAPAELPQPGNTTNVIHAQQVQVNQNSQIPSAPEAWEVKVEDPKRLEMLKAIDG